MIITTLLLSLVGAGLVAATFYFVGVRAGERLGRDQTRRDLGAIALRRRRRKQSAGA